MNIFKWILMTALIHGCFCSGVQAQTVKKTLEFNNAWGTDYRQNYVKNPSARRSSQTNVNFTNNFNGSIGSGNIEGTNGFDLNATATGGYGEWALNPFDDEDKVGNCQLSAYTKGTAANYKLQIVDGSGTELSSIQLQTTTDWTESTAVYPCGATGARKARIAYTSTGTGATFNAGRITYKKYTGGSSVKPSSNPASYTPILTNLGTGATSNLSWYQDGAFIFINGTITCGTSVPTSVVTVSLPSTFVTPSNIPSITTRGTWGRGANSVAHGGLVLVAPSVSTFGFSVNDTFGSASTTTLNFTTGNGVCNASETVSIDAKIPIAGASNLNGIPASLADAPMTWVGATTVTGITANPTKGTIGTDRIGYALDSTGAWVRIEYRQTSSGVPGTGDILFTLPGGLQFADGTTYFAGASILATSVTIPNVIGSARVSSQSNDFQGGIVPYDATRFRIILISDANSRGAFGSGLISYGSANLSVSVDFWAPMKSRVPTANAMLFGGTVITRSENSVEVLVRAKSSGSGCTLTSFLGIASTSAPATDACRYVFSVPFSSTPQCMANPGTDTGATQACVAYNESTTSVDVICRNGAGASLGNDKKVSCSGPK